MNFKPILFSTPMAQAILDGRKTMTRRIIKGVPAGYVRAEMKYSIDEQCGVPEAYRNKDATLFYLKDATESAFAKKAKYQIGDIMWGRESWGELYDTCDHDELPGCPQERWTNGYIYRASDNVERKDGRLFVNGKFESSFINYWKPSIFMPKEACRIFLKVTGVRVERLQDISIDDCYCEGIENVYDEVADYEVDGFYKNYLTRGGTEYPRYSFCTLWESINGPKSWDANSWVWAYTFEQIEKPKNFLL